MRLFAIDWRRRLRRATPAIAILALSGAGVWVQPGPASAAAEVTKVHLTFSYGPIHFDAEPGLPCTSAGDSSGTTTFTDIVVTTDSGLVHEMYHENFTYTATPDDPTYPTLVDKGAETSVFTISPHGAITYTSTLHDFARGENGAWLKAWGLVHVMIQDNEPAGYSENDIVRARFDKFSFTCSYV